MTQPRVIAQDGALYALDKPHGFAAHPQGDDGPDLVSWAAEQLGVALAPCHRLDRETSGVMLCATDERVRAEIGGWLASGEVQKRYRALVHGRTNRKGIVRRPLSDRRRGRDVPTVTRFTRRAIFGRVSLLDVRPETGRRHQIRRHLQGIGHPIVGDERYPPRRFRPVPGFPGRLWLHAVSVTLPDGRRFESPLPPELADHLALLEGRE